MQWSHILAGIWLGFLVAAPKGPIGLTCIRFTLTSGWSRGIAAGLGAATGHALLAVLACLGASWLDYHKRLIQLFGGAFLIYLAVRIWMRNPVIQTESADETGSSRPPAESFSRSYWTTLGLQMATPVNSFLAQTAYLNSLGNANHRWMMTDVTLGVFSGSLLWWLILVSVVSRFRSILKPSRLIWINRIAASAFIFFGIKLLVAFFTGD